MPVSYPLFSLPISVRLVSTEAYDDFVGTFIVVVVYLEYPFYIKAK
jgi:hypothetical protein